MVSLFWASLLALPTGSGGPPTTQPLALKDSRFHYAVSALAGPANARTRTLVVQPAQGQRAPRTITLTGPAAQEPTTNVVCAM